MINNFFARSIEEINIRRCDDDLQIVSSKFIDIYQYSDTMLKQMPKDVLKTYKETLLYSKKSNFTSQ